MSKAVTTTLKKAFDSATKLLARSEQHGGHANKDHVGLTEQELKKRLKKIKGPVVSQQASNVDQRRTMALVRGSNTYRDGVKALKDAPNGSRLHMWVLSPSGREPRIQVKRREDPDKTEITSAFVVYVLLMKCLKTGVLYPKTLYGSPKQSGGAKHKPGFKIEEPKGLVKEIAQSNKEKNKDQNKS